MKAISHAGPRSPTGDHPAPPSLAGVVGTPDDGPSEKSGAGGGETRPAPPSPGGAGGGDGGG
eukprot:7080981-Prymnesium_polylepis.1